MSTVHYCSASPLVEIFYKKKKNSLSGALISVWAALKPDILKVVKTEFFKNRKTKSFSDS